MTFSSCSVELRSNGGGAGRVAVVVVGMDPPRSKVRRTGDKSARKDDEDDVKDLVEPLWGWWAEDDEDEDGVVAVVMGVEINPGPTLRLLGWHSFHSTMQS